MELDGCRFKRMFVGLGASLKGFVMGCRKMLFLNGTHLSGPYKGTMLAAVALDADDHLFDVAYAIVGGETNEDWLWFLTTLHECLGGLKPVVMSDRKNGLLVGVPRVFGAENHTYYVRHLTENLTTEAGRLGIRSKEAKDLIKEMFNRVAYATTAAEYDCALQEMRTFKRKLALWVEKKELERWAQSKFKKERWGKLNNNPIESWNNWMRKLPAMSIPWLVLGHLQKVGMKWDNRKGELQK